tara:strand:- start:234 stop:1160 length:927 start_codon:yes stop_codon:yes gene_type:complete
MIKGNSKILKLKHYLNKIYIPGHKSFHPGFEGITFLNLFQFVKEIFFNGNFAIRSAAVSFHLFVGIFPTLIFFLSLIPFLPFDGIQQYILNFSQDILPNIIYEKFEKTINDLIVKRFKGLLSIGFILSLYYASLGINTLFTAFSQSYQIKLKNHYFKQQFLSLFVFMCILILFILATQISHLNEEIFTSIFPFKSNLLFEYLFKLINFIIEVILVMLGIGILFHFGNPSSTKFRFVNAGTIITSLVILLASSGLSIYFNNFNYYNKVYGSIGSLLIALVWLNIVSYVIIIGFELYAKIDEIKNKFIKS